MALVQLDKQKVIEQAKMMIKEIEEKRAEEDAAYVADYQKPSFWNFWRGATDLPIRSLHYPTIKYGRQLIRIQLILIAAEITDSETVTLTHDDIDCLKFQGM